MLPPPPGQPHSRSLGHALAGPLACLQVLPASLLHFYHILATHYAWTQNSSTKWQEGRQALPAEEFRCKNNRMNPQTAASRIPCGAEDAMTAAREVGVITLALAPRFQGGRHLAPAQLRASQRASEDGSGTTLRGTWLAPPKHDNLYVGGSIPGRLAGCHDHILS